MEMLDTLADWLMPHNRVTVCRVATCRRDLVQSLCWSAGGGALTAADVLLNCLLLRQRDTAMQA
jgi:hypothetical protein